MPRDEGCSELGVNRDDPTRPSLLTLTFSIGDHAPGQESDLAGAKTCPDREQEYWSVANGMTALFEIAQNCFWSEA
jgi:hypothetical protein